MSAASSLPQDHHALIAPIARAVVGRFRNLTSFEELQQAGAIAAIAAVADLDPGRPDVSQRAYLRLRIRGAMVDPIRRELGRREVSFDTEAVSRQEIQTMAELLLLLPPRPRAILELRIQGYSQAETGVQLGVSQSRVSRLEARAVRMLRRRAE